VAVPPGKGHPLLPRSCAGTAPDALTLRAVARAAGVSEAAPYRHFSDRRALVAAVAEQGLRSLQQAMIEAVGKAEGRLALKRVAVAYVRFV
jgi:AcrR family transcriptional regulator